jgi:hypothetical protein
MGSASPKLAGLVLWSLALWTVALLVLLTPILVVRAGQHDTTPGRGLGYLGLFFMAFTVVVVVPVVLAGVWLAGYIYWRGRTAALGQPAGWRAWKVLGYLGLGLVSVYVVGLSAWNLFLTG